MSVAVLLHAHRLPHTCRCGIFGYYTYGVDKELRLILIMLFNGLKRLEYRGYDSAGLAFDPTDAYPVSSKQVCMPSKAGWAALT
jgi:glucosamine--fructose-6-phosphate aminotransferase (isomerizing)